MLSDASEQAIGAVLLQPGDHGDWHTIAFTSRRSRPEEKPDYTAMEKETLAAVHALRTWRHYLVKPFELITENQCVTYLKSKSGLSRREARWVKLLADLDVEIVRCPGRENLADALCRLSLSSESRLSEVETGRVAVTKVVVQASKDFSRQLAADYKSDKKMYRLKESIVIVSSRG